MFTGLTAAFLLAAPPSEVPAKTVPEPSPWTLGGFIDTAYLGNTNAPKNHVYRGMFTSPRTNEITLNLAALYVKRDPGERDPFHFELALQAGAAADALVSGEPTPGGSDSQFAGADVWKHLGRANFGLSFRTGTDISAGLMVSPIGIGVAWTKENWTYTTPWALNGVPYYLLGGRVSQKIGDKVELQAWIVNGWQTMSDVNRAPSYMAVAFFYPVPDLTVQEVVYFGPDDVDTGPEAWRLFSNTQVVWASERFGLGGNFDIGRERVTALPDEPVTMWLAVAGTTRARILGKKHTWDMGTRAGGYWDRDGRIYGVPQWLLEAVYTNDVRLFDHVLLRLEYRYDQSTADHGFFFAGAATNGGADGLARSQHTLLTAITGYFDLVLPKLSRQKRAAPGPLWASAHR